VPPYGRGLILVKGWGSLVLSNPECISEAVPVYQGHIDPGTTSI